MILRTARPDVDFTLSFAWPAVRSIDTFGRRALLLFTFPHMAWTLLAAGLCFLIPSSNGAHIGLIAFFIFLFAAFYSPGEGPVPFTYSAEAFPLFHRGKSSPNVLSVEPNRLLIESRSRNESSCGYQPVLGLRSDYHISPLDCRFWPNWSHMLFRVRRKSIYWRDTLTTMDNRGLNVIAFVMIFLWVPETKQRTLEELDYICKPLP